jgi:hypothetical protein
MADRQSEDVDANDLRTPFERFEDLTRRLTKVPKSEVDKLRKKQTARKRSSSRRDS